jgi:hypothetical protein
MRDENRKTEIIKLTSTAEIEMAAVQFAHESMLAKARRLKRSQMEKVLNKVLDQCTVGVVNPGPYSFLEEGGKVEWQAILTGDRIDAMLQLRKLSYKEGNTVLVPDLRCLSCREQFSWKVNIDEDLFWQPLPEGSIEQLKSGEPFQMELNGYTIFFVLQTGLTQERFRKLAKQHKGERDMTAGLRSRIVDVKNPDGEMIERLDILDWLDGNQGRSKKFPGLSSDDAEQIRDEMDRVDGGVDLEVTAQCIEPDCGAPMVFDLPFDTIFMPGTGIKERRIHRRGREF